MGGKNLEKFANTQNRYEEKAKSGQEAIEFPGAYKENTNVLALMRDGKTWKLAEIYKVKKATFFDTPVRTADCDLEAGEDFTKTHLDLFIEKLRANDLITEEEGVLIRQKEEVKNSEDEKADSDLSLDDSVDPRTKFIQDLRNSLRYEYYVHYLGLDRRLDRWVSEHFIRVDPSEISRQQDAINQ